MLPPAPLVSLSSLHPTAAAATVPRPSNAAAAVRTFLLAVPRANEVPQWSQRPAPIRVTSEQAPHVVIFGIERRVPQPSLAPKKDAAFAKHSFPQQPCLLSEPALGKDTTNWNAARCKLARPNVGTFFRWAVVHVTFRLRG